MSEEMSEQHTADEQPAPDEQADAEPLSSEERVAETAQRLGRALGRFTRQARSVAEEQTREHRPEVERLARQVRGQAEAAARAAEPRIKHAAEVARPRVEQAGRQAVERSARFVQEHESEFRQAANASAHMLTSRATPPVLRPIVTAVTDEVIRPRPPRRDPMSPPPYTPGRPPSGDPSASGSTDDEAPEA